MFNILLTVLQWLHHFHIIGITDYFALSRTSYAKFQNFQAPNLFSFKNFPGPWKIEKFFFKELSRTFGEEWPPCHSPEPRNSTEFPRHFPDPTQHSWLLPKSQLPTSCVLTVWHNSDNSIIIPQTIHCNNASSKLLRYYNAIILRLCHSCEVNNKPFSLTRFFPENSFPDISRFSSFSRHVTTLYFNS